MPPSRGAKYKQRQTSAAMLEAARRRKTVQEPVLAVPAPRQPSERDLEWIRLARLEKARRAPARQAHQALIRRIVTEADQREAERMSGGRPRKHGPRILLMPKRTR